MTRDYFFEFAGMPKSGKTTICDIVVHFLKRSGFRVTEYHGGGRYAPIDKSSLPALNLYLAVKAVEFLVTNVEREKVQHRIFMMDRGLFDRRVFTRTLLNLKKIDAAEATVVSGFLGLPRLIDQIDGVFLFLTRPELSLAREYKNKLVEGPGRVMNECFLAALRTATEVETAEWQKSAKHVRVIDTSAEDGNVLGCSRIVADDISRIVGMSQ
jgi:hypothetical protein